MQGLRKEVIDSTHVDTDLLVSLHQWLIAPMFEPEEREDVASWLQRLEQPSKALRWYAILLVEEASGAVVAGTTIEFHVATGCALLSYVVTHERMRGRGLASIMVRDAYDLLRKESFAHRDQTPLAAMFIDVLQVSSATTHAGDATVSTISPAVRQALWKKMNFVPLDVDLVLPGRHGKYTYNLAVYVPPPLLCGNRFPAATALSFIVSMVKMIVEEEGADGANTEELLQNYHRQLGCVDAVALGHQHWR